jgi:predicted nuclease of predicted toxin-antitoxin system
MDMRFFADHCIPTSIIQSLQDGGFIVYRLRDYIPPGSSDPVVISKAQELDAILISLNGDFSDIVTYPPSHYKGIIAIQLKNHPELIPKLMEKLKHYLSLNSDMNYYRGKLIIAEVHKIRIRH